MLTLYQVPSSSRTHSSCLTVQQLQLSLLSLFIMAVVLFPPEKERGTIGSVVVLWSTNPLQYQVPDGMGGGRQAMELQMSCNLSSTYQPALLKPKTRDDFTRIRPPLCSRYKPPMEGEILRASCVKILSGPLKPR